MPRYDDLPFAPLPGRGADATQFWQALRFDIFTTLRVCVPATVVAWTPPIPGKSPATVDLLLDFIRVRAIDNPNEVMVDQGETLLTTSTGLYARGPRPTYRAKPYLVPSAGASFSMRGPIGIGTTGLYIIADRCIDEWINLGGPVDPATADRHDLNDGFFLPLVYHGLNTPVISAEAHQLGPDDGTAGFEILTADKSVSVFTEGPTATVDAATLINIGAAATEAIAKAESLISAIDTMLAGGVPVANDGGANLKATMIAAWNGVKNSIKAVKGRVE